MDGEHPGGQAASPPAQWTLRLGRGLLGVPVSLHWGLLLLPLFLYVTRVYEDQQAGQASAHWRILGLAFLQTGILTFFVYLHELGHTLAALHTATPVPEIILYPFGGAALMGARMRSPGHELVVAAAGPLVNLAGLGIFWTLQEVFHAGDAIGTWTGAEIASGLLRWMLYANVALGVVNLLPIFPLDGAGIMRALLAFRRDAAQATRLTATVGQILSVPLAMLGIYWGGLTGGLLVALALVGFFTCLLQKAWAREGGIYDVSGGGWDAPQGEAPWVITPTPEARRPGFLERRRERRRRRREEDAAREEAEFQARLDELLAKVKREGLPGLSRAERRLLEEASARLRRRQKDR